MRKDGSFGDKSKKESKGLLYQSALGSYMSRNISRRLKIKYGDGVDKRRQREIAFDIHQLLSDCFCHLHFFFFFIYFSFLLFLYFYAFFFHPPNAIIPIIYLCLTVLSHGNRLNFCFCFFFLYCEAKIFFVFFYKELIYRLAIK